MKIQVTIGGYSGPVCTLYAILDEETDILAVGKLGSYNRDRFKDSVVVTNVEVDDWDQQFNENQMQEALIAWHRRHLSNRLVFSTEAARCSPYNCIQESKIGAEGRRFEFNDEVKNEAIAVVVACWQADTCRSVSDAENFAEQLTKRLKKFADGDIISY